MVNQNAVNDTTQGRRSDYVRPNGPRPVDYRYQEVQPMRQGADQAPRPLTGPLPAKLLGQLAERFKEKAKA